MRRLTIQVRYLYTGQCDEVKKKMLCHNLQIETIWTLYPYIVIYTVHVLYKYEYWLLAVRNNPDFWVILSG